ncbi:DUF899 family protein [Sandarakinorhabdus sp. DWP1-3-1]|uniref:DUF899 family protein n=1 Tax=Sandarakinorhabdus sp. DWP1-3-1 TaxID=2804627 RepID=UPI003CE9ABF1
MTLVPARQLAEATPIRFPNESAEYRTARTALLAEEIELRRRLARVAEARQALPPGGEVRGDYRFIGNNGASDFAGLFGDHDTLIVYSFMFGPERARPCPMCTNFIGPLAANAADIGQQAALAVVARSPYERLAAFARERGWAPIPLYQDDNDAYLRDYAGYETGGDDPAALNVFVRQDGVVRHFWAEELGGNTADPGQDPRGAPDIAPLWNLLDKTPRGRLASWYPRLAYD